MVMSKRYINKKGYELVYPRGSAALAHREIMEQYLGCPIPKGLEVHHINMRRDDNRIENLLLMSAQDHSLIHRYILSKDEIAESGLIEQWRAFAERLKLDTQAKLRGSLQKTITRKRA